MKFALGSLALTLGACTYSMPDPWTRPPAYIVDEIDVVREEAPPHGNIGMSTAYRISDEATDRTMEFRKRSLHPGSAVGIHPIKHDEVYYVVSGEGIVTSDGQETKVSQGMAAYLYDGAEVGIRQIGENPLILIIAYPLPGHQRLNRGPN